MSELSAVKVSTINETCDFQLAICLRLTIRYRVIYFGVCILLIWHCSPFFNLHIYAVRATSFVRVRNKFATTFVCFNSIFIFPTRTPWSNHHFNTMINRFKCSKLLILAYLHEGNCPLPWNPCQLTINGITFILFHKLFKLIFFPLGEWLTIVNNQWEFKQRNYFLCKLTMDIYLDISIEATI